jgi:hypothetical protein
MRVLVGRAGRKAARETTLAGVVPVEISIWIWSEPGTLTGLEMVEPRWARGMVSLWPSRTRDCAVGKHDHCIAWRELGESGPCANQSTTRPSSIQSTVYRNSIMRCRRRRVVVSGGNGYRAARFVFELEGKEVGLHGYFFYFRLSCTTSARKCSSRWLQCNNRSATSLQRGKRDVRPEREGRSPMQAISVCTGGFSFDLLYLLKQCKQCRRL